ncbi:MAG: ABC transporter substrate-binding protein [Mycobacteriales bacterium]
MKPTPWILRSRVTAAAVAALTALSLASCSSSSNNSGASMSLRVSTLPIADLGAYFYALDSGLFKKAGLSVKDTSSTGGAASISAMLSGSVDIAYSGSDSVIKAYAKKLPVRVIAAANNNQPAGDTDSAGLVVPASIGSPAELEGKTLATNALNNVNQIYTQNYLEKNGVDPKKVKFVEVPFPEQVAALKAGRIFGTLLPEPFMSQAVAGGLKVLGLPYRSATGGTAPVASWVSSTKVLGQHDKAIAAFVKTMKTADAAANDPANRPALVKALLNHTKLTQAVASKITLVQYTNAVDTQRLKDLADLLVKYGVLKESPDLSGMISTPK